MDPGPDFPGPPSREPNTPATAMDYRPSTPSPNQDKGKARLFRYSPVCRAPKRDNPFGPLKELEPVQFHVGYAEKGLKQPPLPAKYNFVDSFPTPKTKDSVPTPPRQLQDHDTFYYDAQTSELRSRHDESSQVVPVGDIPGDLRFRELDKGEEYNKIFDAITARYDGVDGLTDKEATHPGNKSWVITENSNAIISFDSEEARAATGTTRATHGPYFGQILKPDDRESDRKPWIKLGFVMNSQHPAIALVLKEEGQNEVTCYFYANSIQRDLEIDEVKFQIRGNEDAGGRHEHIKEVADLRESSDLVQVQVLPWGSVNATPSDGGASTAQAMFTGISNVCVKELAEFADGNHPNEWEALSAREKVIALLHRSQNFSIFRYWPSGGAAPVHSLSEWMDTAMWATAKYGFHWFYQVQSNVRIDAADFPWKDVTIPRWLARTMAIEFDREGKLVTMRPDEWNQLLTGGKLLFPMPVAGDFIHPFVISHAGERQSVIIKKA